jgi:hypothetical protein
MASSTTKAVILDKPSDWEPWLFVVKAMAEGGDTWDYMNPNLESELVVPKRPMMPKPNDVNPTKTDVLTLTTEETEKYKVMITLYRDEQMVTNWILDIIQTIRNHIVSIVSAKNIRYINDKTTLYQMLVALKKRLAPMDYARKLEVVYKYNKLKKFTKKENVED